MRLVVLYGLPATGKLTVAKELASMTGYRLFHNHLVVDLLLSTFAFGSAPFVELRESIWLSVFEQAAQSGIEGMIFTFNPEPTVRAGFIAEMMRAVTERGGEVEFVELVCPVEELRRRMDSPSRLEYRKLSSLELFEKLYAEGSFDTSQMPKARVTVDTSVWTPVEAARQIVVALRLR